MNIKLLMDTAKLPTKGSNDAAGFDLYAAKSCAIEPGEVMKIHTGLAMEIPKGFGVVYLQDLVYQPNKG